MNTDMSPQAVTKRLQQTSELRRLCLVLGQNSYMKSILKRKRTDDQKQDRETI